MGQLHTTTFKIIKWRSSTLNVETSSYTEAGEVLKSLEVIMSKIQYNLFLRERKKEKTLMKSDLKSSDISERRETGSFLLFTIFATLMFKVKLSP